MIMDNDIRWDDLRIAYQLTLSGSLSRAGEHLGINHSTVLRSVTRLEQTLGLPLFIRHQRGYQMTDAGRLLRDKMQPISGDMKRLCNSLGTLESDPSGTLRISTVTDFSPFFAPLLHSFRRAFPNIRVQIVATDDILPLSSGAVHVAIRIGAQPKEPDLVARQLGQVGLGFFCSDEYAREYGIPLTFQDINHHLWVLPTGEKTRIPGIQSVIEKVNQEQVVFQSNSFNDIEAAVRSGMGIGPLNTLTLSGNRATLKEVDLGQDMSTSGMWFVYHKDMRRSARVRALQGFMQQHLLS